MVCERAVGAKQGETRAAIPSSSAKLTAQAAPHLRLSIPNRIGYSKVELQPTTRAHQPPLEQKTPSTSDGGWQDMSSNAFHDGAATPTQQQLPKRSLLETKTYNSFVRNIDLTIQLINPEEFRPDDVVVPGSVQRLTEAIKRDEEVLRSFGSKSDPETVWEDSAHFLRLLEDGLHHIKSATGELRQYIPAPSPSKSFNRRSLSLESLESLSSEREGCAHLLKVAVQTGYETIQEKFKDCIQLVTAGIRQQPPIVGTTSMRSVTCAAEVVAFLDGLVEFETESYGVDDSQFALTICQRLLKDRQQSLVDMFHAVCRYLMCLHESLFLSQHLYAKGRPSIGKLTTMAAMVNQCWVEAGDMLKRVIVACPMFTEIVHEYYGRLLWHAASSIAGMQDSQDLQQSYEQGKVISYDPEVVRDMARAQLWTLVCVDRLRSLISRWARTMRSTLMKQLAVPRRTPQLVVDLRRVMYDLVMITIARSSWLNTYPDQTLGVLFEDLFVQAARTFRLVLYYTKSEVALKCARDNTVADVSLYSALVCATNELRNGVLRLHSLMQNGACVSADIDPAESVVLEDGDTLQFHPLEFLRRLKSRISIKPYPVILDGSTEFDRILLDIQKEASLQADSVGSDGWLASPWLQESESQIDVEEKTRERVLSYDSTSTSNPPGTPCSDTSIDLPTGFVSLESSVSGEVDSAFLQEKAPGRVTSRDATLRPFRSFQRSNKSTSPSPFAEQQPEKSPDVASNAWGQSFGGAEGSSSGVVSVVSSGLVKDVLAADLIPGPIIGKGSEGHVLKMSYHKTPVAVKIMNHTCYRTRERFRDITKLLSKLPPHENIVNFVGQCRGLKAGEQTVEADLAMVMEFCDLGNVYKIISEANWIRQLHCIKKNLRQFEHCFGYVLYNDWRRRLEIARDVAAGVAHMHQHGIVHRDLTSFNVVLKRGDAGQWVAKVCDFERSRHIPEETIPRSDNIANSPAWSAPEVLRADDYSVQADVFSLGVILWELWTLEEPWKHPDQEIRDPLRIIPTVGNGARLEVPEVTSHSAKHLAAYKQLIEDCWTEDPAARPTMAEVHVRLNEMIDLMNASQ